MGSLMQAVKMEKKKGLKLTCMLLPPLHLYINFSSSCKDLNYEPPPPCTGMQARNGKTSFEYSAEEWRKENPISPDSSVLSSSICWLTRRGGRWKGAFELWLRARPLLPRTIAPSFSLLATFRKIWENIRDTSYEVLMFGFNLFKRCIREPISGNVELCQILVKLLEENFKLFHRIFFAVLCWEDEHNVWADLLYQGGCGDVLLDELGQGVDWEPVSAQGGCIYKMCVQH